MSSPLSQWFRTNQLRVGKIALLSGLYAVVVVVPTLVVALGAEWLRRRFEVLWWIVPSALMALLATFAPLIYLTVLRRLEGRVLRDQRRYHRTLIAASSGMTRIKKVEQLCQLIVHVVNRTVQLTHTALFLYDPKEQRYTLRAVRHRSMMPTSLSVEVTDPLVDLLQRDKDLLLADELEVEFEARRPLDSPVMGVAIFREDGVYCCGPNTRHDASLHGTYDGRYRLVAEFLELPLLGGAYEVSVSFYDKDHVYAYAWDHRLYPFRMIADRPDHGVVHLRHRFRIEPLGGR